MPFKMIDTDQTIKIYNLRADTKEFIGSGDAWIPAHTGLPANCTHIEPPKIKNGSVGVFDSVTEKWIVVEDHRGKTVYDTSSLEVIYIEEIGPLPDNVTLIAPSGEYQKWNGTEWVQDTEAMNKGMKEKAESRRQELLDAASDIISDWRTELQLDIISDDDKARLIKWMAYIKQLKAMEFASIIDEVSFNAIEWPEQPE